MKKSVLSMLLALIVLGTTIQFFKVDAAEKTATGTMYYVSSSEGNDSNDGLSESTPIQSMEKASELELTAGDQLLFKRDDYFYGTLEMDLSQGDRENPIRISAYGKGERPKLRHYKGKVANGCTERVMMLHNANGLEITNLEIGWSNAGITFRYDTMGHEYVRIEDCHFHDIGGVNQHYLLQDLYLSCGINIEASGLDKDVLYSDQHKEYALTDIYVNRCTAYNAGSLTGAFGGVKNLYLTECVAENCGYYGTVIAGVNGGYMDRCVLNNNGTLPTEAGTCGIMVSAANFTIRNSIISNQQRQGDDPDGCGIDFEWVSNNITVENVLFKNLAGVSIMFFTSGNAGGLGVNRGTNYDCTVRNCKFVNNSVNVGNIGGFEIFSVNGGADRCVVENNEYVIDYTTKTNTVDFYYCGGESNVELKNNVLVDAIDPNWNPLDGMSATKNATEATMQTQMIPTVLWMVFGVVEGLAVVGIVLLILKLKKSKKEVA